MKVKIPDKNLLDSRASECMDMGEPIIMCCPGSEVARALLIESIRTISEDSERMIIY